MMNIDAQLKNPSHRQLNQLAFDPQLTPGARNAVRVCLRRKSPSSPTKSASRLPPLSFMNWKK
jgi:hypothetical protein